MKRRATSRLQHVHQLVELLDDLLDGRVVAARDDRHAAGVGVVGGADVESVDVVAAPAEQSGDAREHAEFIFHQHRDCVSHNSLNKKPASQGNGGRPEARNQTSGRVNRGRRR